MTTLLVPCRMVQCCLCSYFFKCFFSSTSTVLSVSSVSHAWESLGPLSVDLPWGKPVARRSALPAAATLGVPGGAPQPAPDRGSHGQHDDFYLGFTAASGCGVCAVSPVPSRSSQQRGFSWQEGMRLVWHRQQQAQMQHASPLTHSRLCSVPRVSLVRSF